MKENNVRNKKTVAFYLSLALCIIIAAAITVATVLTINARNAGPTIDADDKIDDKNEDNDNENKNNPVDTSSKYEFILPVKEVSTIIGYTFYKNQTLDCFHFHEGVDFAGDVGDEVMAVLDGTVESITTRNVLDGTVITLSHENGIKTSYTFVNVKEGLAVGDSVNRGDVISTIAEPDGSEYKDGAHLHFEVFKDGTKVDPELYLDISEK